MLTTLRRLSYEEKTEGVVGNQSALKTGIAQLIELLRGDGGPAPRCGSTHPTSFERAQPNVRRFRISSREVQEEAVLAVSNCWILASNSLMCLRVRKCEADAKKNVIGRKQKKAGTQTSTAVGGALNPIPFNEA